MFDLNEVPGQTRPATENGGNAFAASEERTGDGVLDTVAEEVAIWNGKLSVRAENLSTGREIIASVLSEAAKSGNDVDDGGKCAGDRQSIFTKCHSLLAFESLSSKRQSVAGSSHCKDAGLETKSLLARPSLLLPPTPAQKEEAALASVSSPTPRSEETAVNTHLLLSPASSGPLKKRESSLVEGLLPSSKQKQRDLEVLQEAHTFSYEEIDYLRRVDRGQSANGPSVVDQESEDRSISFSPSKKNSSGPPNHLLMDINRSSIDGSSILTTLALRSSSHDLKSCKSMNDSSELALFSKVTDSDPCSKKVTDLSPCWQGRLRTDGPFLTPISAYCLGELTPVSTLRKLPTILRLRKHVKLEELEKDLQHGLTEPVLRFMPSTEASIEEVELFNSLVKELSAGLGMIEVPHVLNSELSQKGQIKSSASPCAALISWDEDGDYSLDAKLYLTSSRSFRMIQLRQLETTSCSLEKLTELDLDSLYGFFCRSNSTSSLTGAPGMVQSGQQDLHRANLEMGSNPHPPTFSPYMSSSTYSETSPFMNNISNRFERKETKNQDAANNKQVEDTITDNYCIKSCTNELDINKEKLDRKLMKENKFEERETESFGYGKTEQEQGLSSGRADRWNEEVLHLSQTQAQDKHQRFSSDIECHKNLIVSEREQAWEEGLEQCKEECSKDKFLQVLQPDHVMGKRMAGSDAGLPFSHKVGSDHGIDRVQIRKRDCENVESFTLIKKLKDSRQLSEQASEHGYEADEKVGTRELLFMPEVELGKLQDLFPCTNLKESEKSLICEDGLELDQGKSKHPDLSCVSVEAIPETSKGPNRAAVLSFEVERSTEMEATFVPLSLRSGENRGVEDMDPSHWDNMLIGSPHASVENKEIILEFRLDGNDKETQTWLSSKQTNLYLQEEYGVNATIKSELSVPYLNSKTESQPGPLLVKISMPVLDGCDATEAKWFVDQAAYMIKAIASRGVFIKCLWYKGPVQLQPGYGPLSIPAVVKKIKGDDGKNLERMQDITGVMIGVVLRKGVVAAPHEPKPQPRLIGLRLKCIRRKGLVEASKQAEALLACVADHFSKELANLADLREARLQQIESVSNQNSPSTHAATKNLLPDLSVKGEDAAINSPASSLKLVEKSPFAVMRETDTYFTSKTAPMKKDPENDIHMEPRKVSSRPLYVSNLPDNITPIKIRHIFENVITDKLGIVAGGESGSDLVVDVRYIQDKFCAFVELASDDLLNACLRLYKEDTSVFQGLSVELGFAANTKTERQSSFSRIGPRNGHAEHARSTSMGRHKVEDYDRRQYGALSNESDSDYGHDLWFDDNDGGRGDHPVDKPRPLFLSELMRNASGATIKKLFEDIITEYIGPSLVCSSGRQLVLDVRYVPSRGCAFVDLATPELVEFMLDLHSRRPEVFMNMKMELGRRPVPFSIEAEKRSNMNARDGLHGKSLKYGYGYRSSGSHKKTEKRPHGGQSPLEYNEDSKSDDYFRQGSRAKKQRSDPEKTVYADRLPGNASEGMIRRIFERVLVQHMTRKELDAVGDTMITEVRHIPPKYCAFVVFATEELTRLALHLYNQDEEIFECMRLKPHFHSRLEDLYSDDVPDQDTCRPPLFKDKGSDLETSDHVRYRQSDSYDARSRLAAHRAVTATAFIEVDRRKSVYVDKIPDGLSEFSMREMFEKVFQHRRPGYDGHIVSQVAYFRDKFDPSKLCAFVELKTEEATQDLVDFYYANQDAFEGMRIRPGLKYSN